MNFKVQFVNKIYYRQELLEEVLYMYKPDKVWWESDWTIGVKVAQFLPFSVFEECNDRALKRHYKSGIPQFLDIEHLMIEVELTDYEKKKIETLKLATKIGNP